MQLHVSDRASFLPGQTGLEVLRVMRERGPEEFAWKAPPYEYEWEKLPVEILLGGPVGRFF